ncbi:MAG: hypothetical protein KTR15_04105 [Phycisphaeraceae bacterium]|nr:hypothetical protein [Phycisphaeraceae bacterium]
MSTSFPPPRLETLDTKPSWHNRAGRVDRSACFALTAAQHWRQVPADDWIYRYRKPLSNASTDEPLSRDRRGVARWLPKGKCDRYAGTRFWARDLWLLHKWEPPYPLQGDFRSAKSNVMRAHDPRNKSTYRKQAQRNDAVLGQGPVNTNRGVGFNHHKMLGLDCLWHTTLRIERYIQHHQLKQHFFVCPVCSPAIEQRLDEQAAVTRPSRRCSAAAKKLPPGRVTKLYLPLCTPQEWHDAQTAELWLRTHCHPNRPWPACALELVERYSELFESRQLRCRQCLGLRYGEVKAPRQTPCGIESARLT